jgi:hypothetical protein
MMFALQGHSLNTSNILVANDYGLIRTKYPMKLSPHNLSIESFNQQHVNYLSSEVNNSGYLICCLILSCLINLIT